MSLINGYIGTYDSPGGSGIYQFQLDQDNGSLTAPQLLFEAKNAKCVSCRSGLLAFPLEQNRKSGVCLMDAGNKSNARSARVFLEQHTACFIAQEDQMIYTANYHEGHIIIYEKKALQSGFAIEPVHKIEAAPKAGCHQVLFHSHYLLVPCLELDEVRIYDRDAGFSLSGKIPFPKDSGPRHGIFNRSHTRLYLVSERSNEVFTFETKGEAVFSLLGKTPLLPRIPDAPASAAAIRLADQEDFLYVSIRGEDAITVLDIANTIPQVIQTVSSAGSHPRDFIISPNGRFLIIVNRTSNSLVSIRRDPGSGLLSETADTAYVPEGVGIILEDCPARND